MTLIVLDHDLGWTCKVLQAQSRRAHIVDTNDLRSLVIVLLERFEQPVQIQHQPLQVVVLELVLAFPLDGLQAECVLGGQHGSIEVADLVLLAGKETFEELDDAAVFLLVEGHLLMMLSDSFVNRILEFFLPIPEQVDLLLEVLRFLQIRVILGLQVEVLPGYEVGLFELC